MATVSDILTKFGEDVVQSLGRNLPQTKDATGSLRDSIHFETKILGNKFVFQLKLNDYYINVNDGRRKGAKLPPEEPIKKWIIDKRLKAKTNIFTKKGNRKLKPFSQADPEHKKQIIQAIRWSIKKKGIKPTYFYDKSVNDSVLRNLKKELIEATKKDIVITIKET